MLAADKTVATLRPLTRKLQQICDKELRAAAAAAGTADGARPPCCIIAIGKPSRRPADLIALQQTSPELFSAELERQFRQLGAQLVWLDVSAAADAPDVRPSVWVDFEANLL